MSGAQVERAQRIAAERSAGRDAARQALVRVGIDEEHADHFAFCLSRFSEEPLRVRERTMYGGEQIICTAFGLPLCLNFQGDMLAVAHIEPRSKVKQTFEVYNWTGISVSDVLKTHGSRTSSLPALKIGLEGGDDLMIEKIVDKNDRREPDTHSGVVSIRRVSRKQYRPPTY